MTVDEHYERLGLDRCQPHQYAAALRGNAGSQAVREYERLSRRYVDCGDLESTQALYHFTYRTPVPGLHMLWSDAFNALDLAFDRVVIPRIADYCAGASKVLDGGCGGGVLLTYLAATHPDIEFVGIDLLPEAIAAAQARLDGLGVTNVELCVADAFEPGPGLREQFDRVILRNILDDSRKPWTSFQQAEFDTVRKLRAVRDVVAEDGSVWVSLTPYPRYTSGFRQRMCASMADAAFTIADSAEMGYMMGGQRHTHVAWILKPSGP